MATTSDSEGVVAYREPIPDHLVVIPMFSFGANMSKDSLRSRGVETASKEPLRAVRGVCFYMCGFLS